jgi:hypothetical protein
MENSIKKYAVEYNLSDVNFDTQEYKVKIRLYEKSFEKIFEKYPFLNIKEVIKIFNKCSSRICQDKQPIELKYIKGKIFLIQPSSFYDSIFKKIYYHYYPQFLIKSGPVCNEKRDRDFICQKCAIKKLKQIDEKFKETFENYLKIKEHDCNLNSIKLRFKIINILRSIFLPRKKQYNFYI